MKVFKVVYESFGLLSFGSWLSKSGLKIQIFDVKYLFLKNLKKTAFSVILRTPGIPKFPSPGVLQVHPLPRKPTSGLSGLDCWSWNSDLVPWELYFGNRIFKNFHILHILCYFGWKLLAQGMKNRKISNFPKCPSKLFCLLLGVPDTSPDSLGLVWVPLEPPWVRWKKLKFCLKIRIFLEISAFCHWGP